MSGIKFRLPLSYERHIEPSAAKLVGLAGCVVTPSYNSTGGQMNFEKRLLQKSAGALMDKAEDCLDLAKTQHKAADQQHEIADKQHEISHELHDNAAKLDTSADKLDTVGGALITEALELKGELEMDAGRTSPRLRMMFDAASSESRPILKAIPK
jgi:hypothetical protein